MRAKIPPLFPPHLRYVEPFGGGASILFAKEPVELEVYNDLDEGLVSLFRVLRDPKQFAEFRRLADLTLYARAEWNECRATWRNETDPIRRAYKWFVVARMSFGGCFAHSWGSVVTTSRRGMAGTCSNWQSTLDALPAIHDRLRRVQIECADWRVILEMYDTPDTLFYCDPPYVTSTRKSGGYLHEMTDADHRELVGRLLRLEGKAVLSGYPSPIYDPLTEAGWIRHDFETACHAAGRTRGTDLQGAGSCLAKQPRTECVWVKPDHSGDGNEKVIPIREPEERQLILI